MQMNEMSQHEKPSAVCKCQTEISSDPSLLPVSAHRYLSKVCHLAENKIAALIYSGLKCNADQHCFHRKLLSFSLHGRDV